jgi:DNA-binding transcriptional ArsR family regulator
MLTETLKALSEPTRFYIVELLKERPYSVNECAEYLEIRQPQASKHLRVLSDAGLVSVKTVAQKHIYSLNPEAFCQLEDWIGSFGMLWEKRLDRLGEDLREGKERDDSRSGI